MAIDWDGKPLAIEGTLGSREANIGNGGELERFFTNGWENIVESVIPTKSNLANRDTIRREDGAVRAPLLLQDISHQGKANTNMENVLTITLEAAQTHLIGWTGQIGSRYRLDFHMLRSFSFYAEVLDRTTA
ncbi:hypothetical protein SUGI_0520850 [Cryptomeria japonica]|nr:hypothetical protein SUGI_0520850 [Cryptomeria japonica]